MRPIPTGLHTIRLDLADIMAMSRSTLQMT